MKPKFSWLAVCLLAAAFLAVGGQVAWADEVGVSGSTQGSFDGGGFGATVSLLGLTYNNATFSGTTAGGILGIGDMPATPNVNNLGSFTLTHVGPGADVYNMMGGHAFTLQVTFTLPTGFTSGNNPATFTATVTGVVTPSGQGGVVINFDNNPIMFTFDDGSATGSFSFSVNDLSVGPGGTVALTGTITGAAQSATAVPEPQTITLLGLGLIAAAAGGRRLSRRVRRG